MKLIILLLLSPCLEFRKYALVFVFTQEVPVANNRGFSDSHILMWHLFFKVLHVVQKEFLTKVCYRKKGILITSKLLLERKRNRCRGRKEFWGVSINSLKRSIQNLQRQGLKQRSDENLNDLESCRTQNPSSLCPHIHGPPETEWQISLSAFLFSEGPGTSGLIRN